MIHISFQVHTKKWIKKAVWKKKKFAGPLSNFPQKWKWLKLQKYDFWPQNETRKQYMCKIPKYLDVK